MSSTFFISSYRPLHLDACVARRKHLEIRKRCFHMDIISFIMDVTSCVYRDMKLMSL